MAKPKLIPWLGLGYFAAAQAICLYVLFGFVPQAVNRYQGLASVGDNWEIPRSIQVFLNTSSFFHHSWYLWIPLLAGVLFGAGWMVWKYREQNWPGMVLAAVATAQLGAGVAMVVVTYQHLASLV